MPAPPLAPRGRLRFLGFPGDGAPGTVEELGVALRAHVGVTACSIMSQLKASRNIGAGYDADMQLIPEMQRSRAPGPNWEVSPSMIEPPANPRRLAGRTFFAGTAAGHFGHVLLETLPRFWPDIDYREYDHFVTIPSHDSGVAREHATLIRKILAVVPIDPDKLVVAHAEQPVWCERIDVATHPFVFGRLADPHLVDVFDRVGGRLAGRRRFRSTASERPSRIYLSRSKLARRAKDKRYASNEREVEAYMQRRGFTVIHPQELSFREQAVLMIGADVVVGCDGSALHLTLFSPPGTKLIALDTRREPNQIVIDRARELDALHVWAADEPVADRLAVWRIDVPRLEWALDLQLA